MRTRSHVSQWPVGPVHTRAHGPSSAWSLLGAALAGAALVATVAAENPYDLRWHSVGSGGGSATGGVYSLRGTIGQPVASRTSGGPYALTGGFWSAAEVIQTPDLPVLGIERLPAGVLRVFWAKPADGVVLQQVSGISGSPVVGWADVPVSVYQTNETHISLTLAAPVGMQIFQLRRL